MGSKQWGLVVGVGCALALSSVLPAPCALGADAQTPISFSGVTTTQRLVIDYQTVAEVNAPGYTLEYIPTPQPRITVAYAGPYYKVYSNPHEVGSFALSQSQIVLLDHLLTFYRKHKNDYGGTLEHFITISLMEGDTVLCKESYLDASRLPQIIESATQRQRKELAITDPPLITFRDIIDAVLDKRPTIAPNKFPSAFASDADQSYADEAVKEFHEGESYDLLNRRMLLTKMPGYGELIERFSVNKSLSGFYDPLCEDFCLDLQPKQPRLINNIHWFIPLMRTNPHYDILGMLRTYRQASNAMAAYFWLSKWKKSGPNRIVELEWYADQPYSKGILGVDEGVRAWHTASLQGAPRYEFFLQRPGKDSDFYPIGTVFFGDFDSRGLITKATPTAPSQVHHWLDRLKVFYSPDDKIPDYVVVARNGRWWRNERPRPLRRETTKEARVRIRARYPT